MEHYSDIMLDKKINKILDVIKQHIVLSEQPIEGIEYCASGYTETNRPPEDAVWQPLNADLRMQAADLHYWLRFSLDVPACDGRQTAFLRFRTGREGQWDAINPQMLLFLDGEIVQGVDVNHTEVAVEAGRSYLAEGYLYTGLNGGDFALCATLEIHDAEMEALYYDLMVPFEAASLYPLDSHEHIIGTRAINQAIGCLDLRDLSSPAFRQSVSAARACIKAQYYDALCGKGGAAAVTCIGHTHIDVAWKWRLCQTVEKAQRSFATVLKLMDEYPEYQFMSSQPQLYQYVKQHAPSVYEGIRRRIREGRWEAEGAMWLEADCNLSGGESLVRQILHGKRFMQQEFGVDNTILWLPDVFGYSAALPQILQKSGVKQFVTSKISWNDMDRMPYDAFLWEGIDGTEIFTYFITAQNTPDAAAAPKNYSTYVGTITPSMALGAWKRFEHKGYSTETCITYGFGDGGGGPTRTMLEYQRRMSCGLPGIPRTQMDSAGHFLARVEKQFHENCRVTRRTPRWCGELYLQFHRGTYTTQAANKHFNRRSEFAYRLSEALCMTATRLLGADYPHAALCSGWETILLNQFHDIIPGSSIHEVYEDSRQQYEQVLHTASEISQNALQLLSSAIDTPRDGILVYNPHAFRCTGVIPGAKGMQTVRDIPAFGWKLVQPESEPGRVTVTENSLENAYYRICVQNGDIVSLVDKRAGRELVKPGEVLNELCFHEDFPYRYDAWEVNEYYRDKVYPCDSVESVTEVDEGARAGLRLVKRFGHSTIEQTLWLYNDSARLDFETDADWQEEHILLKARFPFNLHANEATYEIQYGSVKRPTHTNTSWDSARFEVCAQKWVDISEDDYGVSILNDSKYGYGAEGSTMTISLLRAPTDPDPTADRGHHHFTYSLLAHSGSLAESSTVQESYLLNQPLLAVPVTAHAGTLPAEYSFASVEEARAVMIEAIKRAGDDDGMVLRLYEYGNRREEARLALGFEAKEAFLCDMMENELEPLSITDGKIALAFKPFEILTIKVR